MPGFKECNDALSLSWNCLFLTGKVIIRLYCFCLSYWASDVFAVYRLLCRFIFVHDQAEGASAMKAGERDCLQGSLAQDKALRHLGFLDAFKGLAAQLIVLHHLAFYGPMSDYVRPVAPSLIGWLEMHARIAVHAFLVIGGFLAARSLSPDGIARMPGALHKKVGQRYLKLAPPFLVATLFGVGASVWARSWMSHESISAAPTVMQLLAHALLLHSILGYESISAGAWYVAIDFQLYALFALMVWLCGTAAGDRPRAWLLPAVVLLSVCASLFWFNLDASMDIWAPYFFGSYGLGVLAWWASQQCGIRRSAPVLVAIVVPAACALLLDFRSRIALALFIACMLVWCARSRLSWRHVLPAVLHWLGRISYSVFLIHFPVCLVVNAAFIRYAPPTAAWQALGMLTAWAASVLAGAAFFRLVETPLGRLLLRRGSAGMG